MLVILVVICSQIRSQIVRQVLTQHTSLEDVHDRSRLAETKTAQGYDPFVVLYLT